MRSPTFLLSVLTVVAPVLAQEMPKPAAAIANFDPLLGAWKGEGTYRESAEGESKPWTATMSFSKVLAGFAVQEDLVIDVGQDSPLVMRSVYGYDGEGARALVLAMSNDGNAHLMDWAFPQKGVMTVFGAAQTPMGISVGRSVVEFTKDSYRFRHEGCRDAGKFFTEVEGSFTRAADATAKSAVNASFMDLPISAEMTALAKINGTYRVAGKMKMTAEAPEMGIAGVETITPLFGGHILVSSVVGDPDPMGQYFGQTYFSWNPATSCYDAIGFDSMGMAGKMTCRWSKPGAQLVNSTSNIAMGTLNAMQMIVNVGEHGVSSVKGWAISGASDPYVNFEATYTPKKD
ncbi:MAG: DUF1579 family protein [Planctomycetes bacterium]|nr:DUF1579 family protein [Planctomycetota bacterium]